jgi:hypothetical protein
MRRARLAVALGAVGALAALGGLAGCGDDRQAEVAARGRDVMPFDLDTTTHTFRPTDDGGVQTVTSDVPDDAQVAAIRDHLREEAEAFAIGDYADPVAVHGADMPGVDALSAGAERITVTHESLDDGAAITFTTSDPSLVAALHDWFDAQLSDHGAHAEHG